MSERGFFGVGLWRCKSPINLGSAVRAAGCFGASFVAELREERIKRELAMWVAQSPEERWEES